MPQSPCLRCSSSMAHRSPPRLDALAEVTVSGEVVAHTKGPKIIIHKFKNKTGYHKRQGHRQPLTQVKVTAISVGSAKADSAS